MKPIVCLILFFSFIKVASGQFLLTRDIKSFGAKGDGKSDDHKAFQKAAAFFNARKGNGTLIISKGKYLVGNQIKGGSGAAWFGEDIIKLEKCGNMIIRGEQGAVIKMKNDLRIGAYQPGTILPYESGSAQFTNFSYAAIPGSIISLRNCNNITIEKINLDGNNQHMLKGGKFGDTGYQLSADGIIIWDSQDIKINSVDISYCGRDGLQIINKTPKGYNEPSQKLTITNSSFTFNGRQGFSWVGGKGLRAENCKFNQNGMGNISSAPCAGVDIEAEVGMISDGLFISCEFINNKGCGFVADSGPSRDFNFKNCTFWGISTWSMWTTKPNYNFRNCRFFGSIVQGYDAPNDEDATKFYNCLFEDRKYKGAEPFGRFLVEINSKRRMLFNACTFTTHNKKIFWFEGNHSWRDEEKPLITDCIINIFSNPNKRPDFLAKMDGLRWDHATYNIYMTKEEYTNYYIPGGAMTWLRETKVNYVPKHN